MENGSRPAASPGLTTREGAAPFASTWRREHLTIDERIARGRADFFVAYADQTERDYAAFSTAVDSGRLAARTGP